MDSKRIFVGNVISLLLLVMALSASGSATAAEIGLTAARQVAVAEIQRHVDLHGAWGDAETAEAGPGETIWVDTVAVAHHFEVLPAGHILVAADDRFSPVLLYSTASSFDPANIDDPASIEAWILPEILNTLQGFENSPSPDYRALVNDPATADETARRISSAWAVYLPSHPSPARAFVRSATELPRLSDGFIVGPMMSTRWGQGDYYNDQIPAVSGGCAHALTGCVATAFAQVMRYWQWPYNGDGGHSYDWNGQTISADFEQPYSWDLMPDSLGTSSSASQIDAVAHFMADVAVAVETDYGCGSSSSVRYGDEILDRFFRYKAQMVRHSRTRYSADGWFGLIQGELDADPPRPMLFSIFTAGWSGHEVVIDGYQTGPTDKVHINMGWTGAYNGYYDITHNFTAAYEWQADYQVLVTGIEPDNTAPSVDAGADQVVLTGEVVTLPGNAVDPDGYALGQIQWIQRSGPLVALSDATALSTTFTAPQVTAKTTIDFQLIVNDPLGAAAADTCTVSVFTPQDQPVAEAGIDQTVLSGSQVALRGSALASQGAEIDTYMWLPPADADLRSVSLIGERSQDSSFIAPNVDVDTQLVFTFQVTDTSGQSAEDSCLITIKAVQDASQVDVQTNGDEASSASDGGSRSSGGGPCFISSL